MDKGIIIKSISGFYYVKADNGVIRCKAKGKFKYDGLSPLVGDNVEFNNEGIITQVFERKNYFIRPAVANVDSLVFVASNVLPVTDPFLIDRISVIAQSYDCELVICINKTDLDPGDELYNIFSNSGFKICRTSAKTGEGIDDLKAMLQGKISAFTGNSGVGKSSLLNCILPSADIETGDISEKLGRGKHTTRHVELYMLNDTTFIADTPGFASFDIEMMNMIEAKDLASLFIDFNKYTDGCRFNDCMHINEPGCSLKNALADGLIEKSRYNSYLRLYDIVKNHRSWD